MGQLIGLDAVSIKFNFVVPRIKNRMTKRLMIRSKMGKRRHQFLLKRNMIGMVN